MCFDTSLLNKYIKIGIIKCKNAELKRKINEIKRQNKELEFEENFNSEKFAGYLFRTISYVS